MFNEFVSNENIQLSLPVDPTYVSAARTTASNIAYRMGFEIDCIEDIKTAVSEALTYIIKKSPSNLRNMYTILFCLNDDMLEIKITLKQKIEFSFDSEDISLTMISALVDSLSFDMRDKTFTSLLLKKLKKETILDKLEG